ncbi:MAG: hypothetical protein O2980_03195, partial [Actinomycetota bacterium]|nr:hypothetical protein [Actinomycetota bacterium]
AAICPAGTYSASTGAASCTPASVGFYVPRPGSSEQLRCITATEAGLARCPVPATAPAPTAPTPDAPATGDEPLSPQGDECPPGSWSATGTSRAGSSCTPASPGAFVALPGATAEETCPPGTYSDGFGATECTVAPAGTFVAGAGAMDPVPCPGATEPGLSECPEVLAVPVLERDAEPAGSRSVAWWVGGLLLVLTAGGAGFVLLQRRTGVLVAGGPGTSGAEGALVGLPGLDTTVTDLSVASGTGPRPWPDAEPAVRLDVLEWDEALDGRMDGDETTPPPNPQA